ncbi:MAG: type VI secretion system domain-containing protein [Deltaproteobacteria bacterium]|nr:type VI secretion system domain-containing protein [Deltaproteobacteria bacterium]
MVELGQKILAQDTKDLTVAVYLAKGLLEPRPLSILATTAAFLAEFTENFWDSMFPPAQRLRARKNSMDWWREKTLPVVKRFDGELPAADLKNMASSLTKLDQTLADRDLANIREIVTLVNRLPIKAEPSAPVAPTPGPTLAPAEPEALNDPAKPPSPHGSPVSAPDPGPSSSPAAQALSAEELKKALLAAFAAYLEAEPAFNDPWRWKLTQLLQWFPIAGPPPAEGRGTRLPAPPSELLGSIQSLLDANRPEQALNALESQARVYPFWLDLHRRRVESLMALGDQAAAETLKAEIGFIRRLWPSLRLLTFEDGAPFVSPGTDQWLQEGPKAGSGEAAEAFDPRTLLTGDPTKGLVALGDPAQRPADGRGLFRVRIVEALLWLRLGRGELALGLANWLMDQLDLYKLDSWEPRLTVEALKAAYEIFASFGPAQAAVARAEAARLALANPDEALNLP